MAPMARQAELMPGPNYRVTLRLVNRDASRTTESRLPGGGAYAAREEVSCLIEIRKLSRPFDPVAVHGIADGYRTESRYRVSKREERDRTVISLELVPATPPLDVRWHLTKWDLDLWRRASAEGLALGAFEDGNIVGFCIGEVEAWNRTMRVWEVGVAASHRRQGIGRRLLEEAAGYGRAHGCRVMVCETQNTNVAAIGFYRSVGFEIGAIDLSYYTNDDLSEQRQVAVFMKREL